jgi:hypothetical protein
MTNETFAVKTKRAHLSRGRPDHREVLLALECPCERWVLDEDSPLELLAVRWIDARAEERRDHGGRRCERDAEGRVAGVAGVRF